MRRPRRREASGAFPTPPPVAPCSEAPTRGRSLTTGGANVVSGASGVQNRGKMSHLTVRRRTAHLIEVVPNTVMITRAQRHTLLFAALLLTKTLYLSTLLPAPQFALMLGGLLAAELVSVLREAGLLQPPKAPVLVLPRWRPPGGAGRP